jgi:hypothetical protein
MNPPSSFTAAERWESVKVAIGGGLTAGLLSLLLLWGRRGAEPWPWPPIPSLLTSLSGQTLLVNGAIAALSGALFALTYRYAIRQDNNPQLNAGVVLAFTLVRGLAQVDAAAAIAQHFWPFVAACGESLLIFGGSAIAINLAFDQQWLTPFGIPSKKSSS